MRDAGLTPGPSPTGRGETVLPFDFRSPPLPVGEGPGVRPAHETRFGSSVARRATKQVGGNAG